MIILVFPDDQGGDSENLEQWSPILQLKDVTLSKFKKGDPSLIPEA